MANPTPSPVRREQAPFRLAPELVEWAELHAQPGGVFGSFSHAVERALARLRAEHDLLSQRCKQEGLRLDREALARFYAEDLEATKPSKGGRPWKDPAKNPDRSVKAPATVDVALLAWARDTLVDAGPFEGMSQVVEVGLRRVRAEGPTTLGSPAQPFDPGALWSAFKQAQPQAKRTR
ncbi:MAG: hypothetical protein LC623_09705 [Halobacteriales archaeon]|nr:hypothetical protein [Halobacteriales archaeon]